MRPRLPLAKLPLPKLSVSRLPLSLAHCLSVALLVALPAAAQDKGESLDELFTDYEILELDLEQLDQLARGGEPIELLLGSIPFELELEADDVRAPGFHQLISTHEGDYEAQPESFGTYAGRVVGEEFSDVRLVIQPDFFGGYIRTPKNWYFIDPLRLYVPRAPLGTVVFYNGNAVILDGSKKCGLVGLHKSAAEMGLELPPLGSGLSNGPGLAKMNPKRFFDVAMETDFEYFQHHGSDPAQVINNLNFTFNSVRGVFITELNLHMRMAFQHLNNTANDPYSGTNDAEVFLGELRTHFNTQHGGIDRDAGHLFSERILITNSGDQAVGLAFVGVVCNPGLAYAVTNDGLLRNRIMGHELGHNLNACHVDESACVSPPYACTGNGTWMCGALQGNGTNDFSPEAVTRIDNYIGAVGGCLNQPPTASFTYTQSTWDFFQFDASASSDPNGSIVSYHWDFGNGTSTTTTQPVTPWLYSYTGSYVVTLTVTDSAGDTATDFSTVNVDPNCPYFPCPP